MIWVQVAAYCGVTFIISLIGGTIYSKFLVNVAGPLPGILRLPLAFIAWFIWALLVVGLLMASYIYADQIFTAIPEEFQAVSILIPGVLFGLSFGLAYLMVSRRYRKNLQDIGLVVR